MEIIESGKYGYCFESENPENLALEIEHIIKIYNKKELSEKVAKAYDRVVKEFGISQTAHNYLINY